MADREKLLRLVRAETWAVVGASEDRSKFGNITFRELQAARQEGVPGQPEGGRGGGRDGLPELGRSSRARGLRAHRRAAQAGRERGARGRRGRYRQRVVPAGSRVDRRPRLLRGPRHDGHLRPLHPDDQGGLAADAAAAAGRRRELAPRARRLALRAPGWRGNR